MSSALQQELIAAGGSLSVFGSSATGAGKDELFELGYPSKIALTTDPLARNVKHNYECRAEQKENYIEEKICCAKCNHRPSPRWTYDGNDQCNYDRDGKV